MNTIRTYAAALLAGILIAFGPAGTVLAWHPHGMITKTVQDLTSSGQVSNAASESMASVVAPGDTLRYTVVVSNAAAPASNHDNDMAYSVMTDALPAGVELLSDPL